MTTGGCMQMKIVTCSDTAQLQSHAQAFPLSVQYNSILYVWSIDLQIEEQSTAEAW